MTDYQFPLDDDEALFDLLIQATSTTSPSVAGAGIGSGSEGHSPHSTSSSAQEKNKVRRRPIPRKGHTKSRHGCLNCKRRKVKCQENRPECDHCRRIGLVCEYPPLPPRQLVAATAPSTSSSQAPLSSQIIKSLTYPTPSYPLSSTPSFSMQDLQFFQHFLFTAYPPLPLDGDALWKNVAQLSHEFDFLVHAMLGMSASHLALSSGVDHSSAALTHRVTAIHALNAALSRPCLTRAEGDARFAATMTLAFQAAYMNDGMLEFLSMIRGCHIVARTSMYQGFGESIFSIFTPESHLENVKRLRGSEAPDPMDSGLVDVLLGSLRSLAPSCKSTYEIGLLANVEKAIRLGRHSCVEAFDEFAKLYSWMTEEQSPANWAALVDPNNHLMQVLLMHFFLGEGLVGGDALGPVLRKQWPFRGKIVVAWIERSAASLPPEFDYCVRLLLAIARVALGGEMGPSIYGSQGWFFDGEEGIMKPTDGQGRLLDETTLAMTQDGVTVV